MTTDKVKEVDTTVQYSGGASCKTPTDKVKSLEATIQDSSWTACCEMTTDKVKSLEATIRDSGWAWVVCCACFIVHVIYDGIYFSVGVVFVEFLDYFGRSKRDTVVIVSLCFGVGFILGPLYAFLANRFGCRIVVVTGSIISSTAYILSIFAPNVYVMYLTFGLMAGFGYGCAFLPSILAVNFYFDKRRAFAMGIATSGSGFGTLIFGPLTRYFISLYTWKGAILINAGILLNVIACGLVYLPLNPKPSRENDEPIDEIVQKRSEEKLRSRNLNINEDECVPLSTETNYVTCSNSNGEEIAKCTLAIEAHNRDDNYLSKIVQNHCPNYLTADDFGENENEFNRPNTAEGNLLSNHSSNGNISKPTSTDRCSFIQNYPHDETYNDTNAATQPEPVKDQKDDQTNSKERFGIFLFRNRSYTLFVIASSLASLVYITPFAFIPDKAKGDGIDEFRSSWLISTLGVSGLVGRILTGAISDNKRVNRVHLNAVCLFVCGACVALISVCESVVALFVCCVPIGLSLGGSVTLGPVLVGDLVGRENMAKAFGILNFLWGVTSLVGPPFIGWLHDVTGTYNISFITAGAIFASGGVVLCILSVCQVNTGGSNLQ